MDAWWSRHRNLITSTWLFILFLKCKKNCKLFIGTIFNYQVCKERLFIVCRLWFFYNDGTARVRLTFVRLCIVCRIKVWQFTTFLILQYKIKTQCINQCYNFCSYTVTKKQEFHWGIGWHLTIILFNIKCNNEILDPIS